jgi:hypothetical protein
MQIESQVMRVKSEWRDADGNVIRTEYYAAGEYEALLASEQAENEYQIALAECLENRRIAYLQKGWHSEFDIIDDMARRGVDVVIADRMAIKDQFPKPEQPGQV